jgi:hypothetical protein
LIICVRYSTVAELNTLFRRTIYASGMDGNPSTIYR